jgi:ribosome biogenesis protein MAK21
MAKAKDRRPGTAATHSTAKRKPVDASIPDADSLPRLSDSALANLTKTIEQKLQRKGEARDAPRANDRPNATKSRKTARELMSKSRTETGSKKGKKRNRNARLISGPNLATEKKKNPGSNKASDGEALEREIYAIGGSKEDYELLAGVNSDSEIEAMEVSRAKGRGAEDEEKLRKDIAKMMKDVNQPGHSMDRATVDVTPEVQSVLPARTKSAQDVSKKLVTTKPTRKEKLVSKDKQPPVNAAASSLVGSYALSEKPFANELTAGDLSPL